MGFSELLILTYLLMYGLLLMNPRTFTMKVKRRSIAVASLLFILAMAAQILGHHDLATFVFVLLLAPVVVEVTQKHPQHRWWIGYIFAAIIMWVDPGVVPTFCGTNELPDTGWWPYLARPLEYFVSLLLAIIALMTVEPELRIKNED